MTARMTAGEAIRAGAPAPCRPWPRYLLSTEAWRDMAAGLALEPGLHFLALWADTAQVHALFHAGAPVIASVAVESGLYAALSPARPAAAWFERTVADLWGHQAANAVDTRPWLDHGVWTTLRPLSDRPVPNTGAPEVPDMAVPPGEVLGFGPLQPVWAEPAHWRVGVAGGAVTAAEARLGYAHRGIPALMRGKTAQGAARLAGRIDGAATVAHATAFARAVEAASATDLPPRAIALRTAMLLIERVAVGLHDLAAAAAACGLAAPEAAIAREGLLQACAAAFGHRLMQDRVQPGGVAGDLGPPALALLDAALLAVQPPRPDWPPGIGVLDAALAWRLGAAGVAARAAAVPDPAAPAAPLGAGGDLAARMHLRAEAILRDAARARDVLAALPEGPALLVPEHASAEGVAMAEGPAGRVWHWVRLAGGVVGAWFAADPGWSALPVAQAAMRGAHVPDLPAIAASLALRTPGMDL